MRKFKSKSKSKRKKQRALLSQALVLYDDEIADFSEDVAFHCDAFACLAKHHEDLSDASVEGLEHSARWLKMRSVELAEKLSQIRELDLGKPG